MRLTRRQFTRVSLAAAGLGVASAVPLGGCAASSGRRRLKFSDVQASSHYTNVAATWMGKQLRSRTGGDLEMKVFPSGALGGPDETILALQTGAVDLAWLSTGQLAREVRELNLLSCAYLVQNRDHFKRLATPGTRPYDRMRAAIERDIRGVRLVGIMGGPARNLYTDGKPVLSPDDLAGRQIRVEDSPVKAETWRRFGADPVPLTWQEIYTALQSGVIEGAESSTDAYDTSKLNEVAPNLSVTEHEYAVLPLLLSDATYRRLGGPERAALVELCASTAQRSWEEGWSRVDALERTELAKAGTKVVHPDVGAFRRLSDRMIDKAADEYRAGALLDVVQEALR